ncbi:hypothetical protein [Mesobacillus boroniphilus]|nr:hypothetical protein [Mesobacillus boroniphilus]
MANQVKHKSNNQSGSTNKKNHQTGKNNRKSYRRTNSKPQEIEDDRLMRVDEYNQKHDGNKGSGNGKPSNQLKKEKVNFSSKNHKSKSSFQQAGNGNGNSSKNWNSNDKSFSNQSKNGNGKNRKNDGGKNSTNQNQESGAKASEKHDVKHKEQSGKFETAFNRIHKALKEMVKGTDSDAFVELLYSGYKNHSLVRKYKSELHQFAKLRNAIVHERVNADYYIAEPHIEVVERIEEICKEFEKPQTALSIATSPVFYYYEDAYLKDVLKVINKFDFTRFPVYDR